MNALEYAKNLQTTNPEALELAKLVLADVGTVPIELEKITALIMTHHRYVLLRSIFTVLHGPTVLLRGENDLLSIASPTIQIEWTMDQAYTLLDSELDREVGYMQDLISSW